MPTVNAAKGVIDLAGWRTRTQPLPQAVKGTVGLVGKRAWATGSAALGRVAVRGFAAIAEQWYAVYDTSTDELVSVGTSVGDIGAPLTAIEIPKKPDFSVVVWDPATHSFITRAAAQVLNRIDVLLSDPQLLSLSAEERALVSNVLHEQLPSWAILLNESET
jgi:hypothetical protein